MIHSVSEIELINSTTCQEVIKHVNITSAEYKWLFIPRLDQLKQISYLVTTKTMYFMDPITLKLFIAQSAFRVSNVQLNWYSICAAIKICTFLQPFTGR